MILVVGGQEGHEQLLEHAKRLPHQPTVRRGWVELAGALVLS
jgi:hypothetical protein